MEKNICLLEKRVEQVKVPARKNFRTDWYIKMRSNWISRTAPTETQLLSAQVNIKIERKKASKLQRKRNTKLKRQECNYPRTRVVMKRPWNDVTTRTHRKFLLFFLQFFSTRFLIYWRILLLKIILFFFYHLFCMRLFISSFSSIIFCILILSDCLFWLKFIIESSTVIE